MAGVHNIGGVDRTTLTKGSNGAINKTSASGVCECFIIIRSRHKLWDCDRTIRGCAKECVELCLSCGVHGVKMES